jgi:hypothetical protein
MSSRPAFTDSQRTIWSWAVHNCSPWPDRPLDRRTAYADLLRFNEVSDRGYVFRISGGEVVVLPKPDSTNHLELNSTSPDRRSALYRQFLQDVVDTWLPDLDTLLCISMCDGAVHHPSLPTFCFQKVGDTPFILLPDVDFLVKGFYEADEFQDVRAYQDKRDGAVFVGATTSAINTLDVIAKLSSPRLDAARFFSDDPDVRFRLPSVVQCESEEARQMLLQLPFCSGGYESWGDQLQFRHLISMDGNGATCSRVVLSLKSNSTLLKYRSRSKLYYFDFLQPNVHYIDITRHGDVKAIVDIDRRWPNLLLPVVKAGKLFADTHLDRAGVQFYMASLLTIYDSVILRPEGRPDPDLTLASENAMDRLMPPTLSSMPVGHAL